MYSITDDDIERYAMNLDPDGRDAETLALLGKATALRIEFDRSGHSAGVVIGLYVAGEWHPVCVSGFDIRVSAPEQTASVTLHGTGDQWTFRWAQPRPETTVRLAGGADPAQIEKVVTESLERAFAAPAA